MIGGDVGSQGVEARKPRRYHCTAAKQYKFIVSCWPSWLWPTDSCFDQHLTHHIRPLAVIRFAAERHDRARLVAGILNRMRNAGRDGEPDHFAVVYLQFHTLVAIAQAD